MDAQMTHRNDVPESYEPPVLYDLGTVHEQTLTHGCLFNKQWGGSDGFTFMGIDVPISNCSS
jgi:hypothetical protein